jgi:putative membrane protein
MQSGKKIAFGLTLAVFAATWVSPLWPTEQALHSSLTVVGLAWLWRHDRRWPMLTRHFVLICVFICVHSIAARWLYSNFPYDRWLQMLLGWSPGQAFGWQRNHTDRLIHALYGACFAPALRHYLGQRWPLDPRQAFAIAVMLVMCSSLAYEWLEWGIALALSPEAAESYNGQQGDIWDAHADMLLATLGALAAWPLGSAAPASRIVAAPQASA